jgi:hypothetical protein
MKSLASLSRLFAAFRRKEALGLRCAAAAILPLERRHVKLTPATIIIHVADLAKNRALGPAHVMNA